MPCDDIIDKETDKGEEKAFELSFRENHKNQRELETKLPKQKNSAFKALCHSRA